MANIIAQAQMLSGFFSKLAKRFYDARLAKAERDVKATLLHIARTRRLTIGERGQYQRRGEKPDFSAVRHYLGSWTMPLSSLRALISMALALVVASAIFTPAPVGSGISSEISSVGP